MHGTYKRLIQSTLHLDGEGRELRLADGCSGKESKFSFGNIALFRFPMVQWLDLHLFAYEQHKLDSMSNKKRKGGEGNEEELGEIRDGMVWENLEDGKWI